MLGAKNRCPSPARWIHAGLGFLCLAVTLGQPAWAAGKGEAKRRAEADALFTNAVILRLALQIPEAGMATLRQQVRRQARWQSVPSPREYVRATLRDGNTTYTNVAVHLKGSVGSFRPVDDRPGLTLHFRHFDPEGPLFHGLKKVHLDNSVQDPTCLNEFVGSQLFRDAGVPAARVAHALVELNGSPLDLYVVMEAMNKDFLARYFQNPTGNLYGQSAKGDVDAGLERMEGEGPLTREDLKALAAALQEKDPTRRVERLEKTLDVDRFLSFMALEIILCHWDSYTFNAHNFRIYQDVDQGRMVFFPHDMDQLFIRQNLSLNAGPPFSGWVARVVAATPPLEARLRERYCQLATNLFVVPRLAARVDQVVASILPTLTAYDTNRARRFSGWAGILKSHLSERGLKLQREVATLSGAGTLAFHGDVARLSGWLPANAQKIARLEQVKDADGKSALWINTSVQTLAAWRTQVLLAPGRYRFEGLVRCRGVKTALNLGEGAALAVTGSPQTEQSVLKGDSDWKKLSLDFTNPVGQEVQLDCELWALKGEAWFDLESLRLVRLPTGGIKP
jgi:spore coat protein H